MKNRKYTKLLAGLLCAAMLSADFMSVGSLSFAAEMSDVRETEAQTQEDTDAQDECLENVCSSWETEASDEAAQTQRSEIWIDMVYLLKTFKVVLTGKGAY